MLIKGSIRARLAAMLAAAMIASGASGAGLSVAPESPGTALSRHIRILAGNPRDFNALIGAGRAALELGDVQAAAGFFGRAEEVNPNAPAAKAGLGAAMAHMGDADGAIFYFDQASRLGAAAVAIALDRGLARDLNGQLGAAQSDYRLAIQSLNSDEGRRRLALSLAIGRDRAGALAAIQPLLNRRDAAAQRTRAFVLALVGDQAAAAQAIESVMPGGSARFAPFFTYLPHLSVQEKAAAVHLGMFPDNAAAKVAAAQAAQKQATQPPQLAMGGPAPSPPPARQSAPPAPAFSLPSTRTASASPSFSSPSASSAPPTASNEAPAEAQGEGSLPSLTEDEASIPALAAETAAEGNLTGIDKLLATIAEAPPAPQPKVETRKLANDKAAKAAAAKKAAEKKAREEKLAAEKKVKEEAARLGVKGTYWVQLAGGSNQDRMASEYKRLSAKAGKLLKSRAGYVTDGKSYFRLIVGPFDSKSDSQTFVNKLEREGVDGFSWTRTPAQIKIERLSSR
jgi:tetratricopeptide (TPR) repeat protein